MSFSTLTLLRELHTSIATPGSTDDFGGAVAMRTALLDARWPSGTGDNQADQLWCDFGRTVATATNDDLDLTALSATHSPTGVAVNFAEIRAILLFWYVANTTNATLQPGASNGWTAFGASFLHTIKPGTYWRTICGVDGKYPTSGTDKVLRIANSAGATATYDIAILGTSV